MAGWRDAPLTDDDARQASSWRDAPLVDKGDSWRDAPLVSREDVPTKPPGDGKIRTTMQAFQAETPGEVKAAKKFMLARARAQVRASPLRDVFAVTHGLSSSLISASARLTGQTKVADYMTRYADALRQASAELDVEEKHPLPPIVRRGFRGASESLGVMALAAPAGPYAIYTIFGLQEANQSITEGKDAGLEGADLWTYAVGQGVIEAGVGAVFQKLGFGGIESIVGGKVALAAGVSKALKQLGILTLQELPEELITELGHNVARAVSGVDPEATSTANLTQMAADTTVQTLITMGMVSGPMVAVAGMNNRTKKEIVDTAESGKAPSRKQWSKKWGLPVDKIKSAEDRLQAVQELAGEIQRQREAPSETTAPEAPAAPEAAAPVRKSWDKSGAEIGELYHGGKGKVSDIDLSKTQQRDSGFYGAGFYMTSDPKYAKAYGKTISKIKVNPNARVVVASLNPKEAPEGLVDEISGYIYNRDISRAKERGKEKLLSEEVLAIKSEPLAWGNAVNEYARSSGYDIVKYSEGEIVGITQDAFVAPEGPASLSSYVNDRRIQRISQLVVTIKGIPSVNAESELRKLSDIPGGKLTSNEIEFIISNAIEPSEASDFVTPEMPAIDSMKREATESIPKKKGFLKEEAGAKPVTGGKLGQRERADVIAGRAEVDMSVGIPEVDARLEAARGIKREGLFEKIKGSALTAWHYATRSQANIPKRDPFFATGNETFRLLKTIPRSSRDEAIRITRTIIDPLGPKQLELFSRYIQSRNQLAALDNGQPLRHGFSSRGEVEAYHNKLDAMVNLTPEVKRAVEFRVEAVRDVVGAAVAHNLLPETALQNAENYYHQQVMMYHAARKTSGTRSTLSRAKKSFQRRRVSGPEALDAEYDYNTDYIESEVSWMSDALGKIRSEQLLDKLISTYGRTQEFKMKAKAENVSLSKVVRDDESVALWQPMPGNVFYRAFSVPEKIAEQLQSGALESFDLTKDELRDVVAIGSNRESVVLPREIVDELESAKSPNEAHWIDKLNQGAIKAWKAWSTVGPKRIFSYSVRNITGDISPVIAVDPGILKEATATVSDLRGLYKVTKPLSEVQRASRDLGVVSSGFFASEVSDIGNLSTFNYLDTAGKQTIRALTRPDVAYLNTVAPVNNFREDVLRHSAFRYYRKKLNNNEEVNYGASQEEIIKQLQKDMGNDVAAAHIARNLIGDYGDMTVAGEWLRRHLVPFWSFQEINLKRWPQITINAIKAGRGKGRLAVVYSAIATMRLAQGYAALYTWNNVIAPFIWGFDDDDDLSSYDKANPHIILGRTADGSIRLFRNVGAIGDFFEWFGINEAISLMDIYKSEQVEESDIIKEMLKSPIEKIVGGLRPDIKGGFEILTGQSLFPSPFEPRSVGQGEAAANVLGMSDEYKWVKGMMLGDGNTARKNYWLRYFVGVVDPRQAALGEIYDLRRRFLDSKGARGRGVYPVSEYKIARDAVTNEDYNSFVKWKVAFQKRHPRNYIRKFKSFLKGLDPIASRLGNADEYEFVNKYLNGEQRVKLKAARDYADEMRTTLLVWWRAAERSGDKLVE